ncbi:MAG: winged helix DNA-binding domain-containing protein [Actinobacteria bacterium]|nr:winged helix DNA-binding domain-containing protein [Actinomycetota bacterium]
MKHLGVVQIDSVNVLARAHHMPAFSRLGVYDRSLLDVLAYRDRKIFEYWGHAASYLPIDLFPYFRWKMTPSARTGAEGRWLEWAKNNKAYIDAAYKQVKDRGPMAASELADPGQRNSKWWGWAIGKTTMEYLFLSGKVMVSNRRNFERLYDLTERVIPEPILDALPPTEHQARKHLLTISAKALGVGTLRDFTDYFRLAFTKSRSAFMELVEEGTLLPVEVEGWTEKAWMYPGIKARPPRMSCLVSPFDPLVWERARTSRLFGFDYKIEIYVPAPQRKYGYYSLPFLMGERIAGRVDLKADRKNKTLLVHAVHAEQDIDPVELSQKLAVELARTRTWLGLENISVVAATKLARSLRSEIAASTD